MSRTRRIVKEPGGKVIGVNLGIGSAGFEVGCGAFDDVDADAWSDLNLGLWRLGGEWLPDILERGLVSSFNAGAITGLSVGSGLDRSSTTSGLGSGFGLGSSRDLANVPNLSVSDPPRR